MRRGLRASQRSSRTRSEVAPGAGSTRDGAGRWTEVREPGGTIVTRRLDFTGQALEEHVLHDAGSPAAVRTRTTYDARDLPTRIETAVVDDAGAETPAATLVRRMIYDDA